MRLVTEIGNSWSLEKSVHSLKNCWVVDDCPVFKLNSHTCRPKEKLVTPLQPPVARQKCVFPNQLPCGCTRLLLVLEKNGCIEVNGPVMKTFLRLPCLHVWWSWLLITRANFSCYGNLITSLTTIFTSLITVWLEANWYLLWNGCPKQSANNQGSRKEIFGGSPPATDFYPATRRNLHLPTGQGLPGVATPWQL